MCGGDGKRGERLPSLKIDAKFTELIRSLKWRPWFSSECSVDVMDCVALGLRTFQMYETIRNYDDSIYGEIVDKCRS